MLSWDRNNTKKYRYFYHIKYLCHIVTSLTLTPVRLNWTTYIRWSIFITHALKQKQRNCISCYHCHLMHLRANTLFFLMIDATNKCLAHGNDKYCVLCSPALLESDSTMPQRGIALPLHICFSGWEHIWIKKRQTIYITKSTLFRFKACYFNNTLSISSSFPFLLT